MEKQVRKNTIYRLNRLMAINRYIPNIKVILLIILLIFLLNSGSWAAIYHVDATNGSDSNSRL